MIHKRFLFLPLFLCAVCSQAWTAKQFDLSFLTPSSKPPRDLGPYSRFSLSFLGSLQRSPVAMHGKALVVVGPNNEKFQSVVHANSTQVFWVVANLSPELGDPTLHVGQRLRLYDEEGNAFLGEVDARSNQSYWVMKNIPLDTCEAKQ